MTTIAVYLPTGAECTLIDQTITHQYDTAGFLSGFNATVTIKMQTREERVVKPEHVRIIRFKDRTGQEVPLSRGFEFWQDHRNNGRTGR